MASSRYSSELSDSEWQCLKYLISAPKHSGRPRLHSPREILNAVFYLLKSGCRWRMLPKDYPPWKTVYHYFRIWRIDGPWEVLHAALRERLRRRLRRNPYDPTQAQPRGHG